MRPLPVKFDFSAMLVILLLLLVKLLIFHLLVTLLLVFLLVTLLISDEHFIHSRLDQGVNQLIVMYIIEEGEEVSSSLFHNQHFDKS